MQIKISKYNDVWLDNGLATFCQLLQQIEGDGVAEVSVDDDEVSYEITDEQEFIEELTEVI